MKETMTDDPTGTDLQREAALYHVYTRYLFARNRFTVLMSSVRPGCSQTAITTVEHARQELEVAREALQELEAELVKQPVAA